MDIDRYKLNVLYVLGSIISMESVATFMIVLIMKLMPQIQLYVIHKHGAITYKNTMIEVICV